MNSRSAEGQGARFSIDLPALGAAESLNLEGKGDLVNLLWRTAEFYREERPEREDVVIDLLTSEFESLWPGIEIGGWRAEFLQKIAEPMEAFNEEYSAEAPMLHGYMMGVLVGVAAQVDTPPRPDRGDWSSPPISEVLSHILARASFDVERGASARETINVPEKYQKIWPFVQWYYEDLASGGDSDRVLSSILPDSLKHPIIPPLFVPFVLISFFGGSIWFLVNEFRVSVWWGVGQLVANIASCLLVIPGMIVGLVFLCMHWNMGKRPFGLCLFAFLLFFLAQLLTPSWAIAE